MPDLKAIGLAALLLANPSHAQTTQPVQQLGSQAEAFLKTLLDKGNDEKLTEADLKNFLEKAGFTDKDNSRLDREFNVVVTGQTNPDYNVRDPSHYNLADTGMEWIVDESLFARSRAMLLAKYHNQPYGTITISSRSVGKNGYFKEWEVVSHKIYDPKTETWNETDVKTPYDQLANLLGNPIDKRTTTEEREDLESKAWFDGNIRVEVLGETGKKLGNDVLLANIQRYNRGEHDGLAAYELQAFTLAQTKDDTRPQGWATLIINPNTNKVVSAFDKQGNYLLKPKE